jgi:hypothetical protein
VVATARRANEPREARFSFPIVRKEYTPEGDLIVYGPCTDGSRDADHQKVDPNWSGPALEKWIKSGGNIRVQHSPFLYPAGKGLALETFKDGTDAHWLKALVTQSTPAFDLVEKGILRDFSIGVLDPVTVFNDPTAPNGTICGGEIGETSLVDRGSNKNTSFTIVKAARKGPAELVLKFSGFAPTPRGVQTRREVRLHAYKTWTVKRKKSDGKVVDSSGRDVSDVPDEDFAGPDKTYPIKTSDDVSDAASLAHHADNPKQVRANIRAIARRKLGMKDEDMPPSLAKDDENCPTCDGSGKIREGHVTCPDCHGSGNASDVANKGLPFPGAAPPFGPGGKKKKKVAKGDAADDYPGDKGDDDEEPEDYDADEDDPDDDPDDDSKSGDKANKAVDARAMRRKLIKAQRKVLKNALAGSSTPTDTDFHPDPEVSNSGAATAKKKKVRPAADARPGGTEADMPGSDWSTKSAGPSYGVHRFHDAICPYFRIKDVKKAYGAAFAGVGGAIPTRELQTLALDATTKGLFDEAAYLTGLLQVAGTMEHLGPQTLMDARKTYDNLFAPDGMTVTGTAPPGMRSDVAPSQFQGGYISAGHPPLSAAGASGGNKLPNATVHHVSASDFQRGFLSAGNTSMSPSGGVQATAGTAHFGQALNSLQRMHEGMTHLWPDMCPVSQTVRDYAATDATGITGATMTPAPATAIGEAANKAAQIATEKRLRVQLAKAQRKARELKEENDRLGSLPDPELAPYRGIPELGGPVDRRSLVGKAVGGADDENMADEDEFAHYVAAFAGSGNPTMRANATKVLAGLLHK